MRSQSSSKGRIIAAVLLLVVILFAGAYTAAYFYFQDRAFPNASVAGVELGGKTSAEAAALLTEKADAENLTVQTDAGQFDGPISDSGVQVNVNATIERVFEPNGSFFGLIPALLSKTPTGSVIEVRPATVAAFSDDLPLDPTAEAGDPTVTFDADQVSFVAREGKSGETVDVSALTDELVAAAGTYAPATIQAPMAVLDPTVSGDAANATAASLNAWLQSDVVVVDRDGDVRSPEPAVRGTWVDVQVEGDKLVTSLQPEPVKTWVQDWADRTTKEPVNGVQNVDESGKVVATPHQPEDGYGVTNQDAVVQQLTDHLGSAEPLRVEFAYADIPAETEKREVDPATAGLRYQAAPGEKWIDVDLTNATTTGYEGSKKVIGPIPNVPGAPITPTVEGEYEIYLRRESQTMRGTNADGTSYEQPGVPWISYFHGSYALHGAPYRDSFGWTGPGGTHGCVVMETSNAKKLWDWSEIGTKVITHK